MIILKMGKQLKTSMTKKLTMEIWRVLKLNDPPTWTEDQRLEWLFKRLDEVLNTKK